MTRPAGDNPGMLLGKCRTAIFKCLVAVQRLDLGRLSSMYRLFSGLIFVLMASLVGCRGGATQAPGVILMRYNPGSQSTEQREKGFLETLAKEFPQVKVVSSD